MSAGPGINVRIQIFVRAKYKYPFGVPICAYLRAATATPARARPAKQPWLLVFGKRCARARRLLVTMICLSEGMALRHTSFRNCVVVVISLIMTSLEELDTGLLECISGTARLRVSAVWPRSRFEIITCYWKCSPETFARSGLLARPAVDHTRYTDADVG